MNVDFCTRPETVQRVTGWTLSRRFVAILLWLSAVSAAQAGTRLFDIENVELGFNGTYRVGAWTPLEFDVVCPQGAVITPMIHSVDPDGRRTLQPLPEVKLTGNRSVHVRGLFRSGKINAFTQIELQENGQSRHLATFRPDTGGEYRAVRLSTSTWLAIGDQPLFSRGLERWNAIASNSAALVTLPDLSREFWSGTVLDGVDALILNGETQLNETTSTSIRDWVRSGGHLVVPVGDGVTALSESPLAKWLPLLPRGQIEIAKLSGLQELVARSSQLRTLTTIPAAQLDRSQGTVIASGLSGPLAMRAAYGSGQVTLVAVKLDEAPLSNWESDSQAQLAGVLAGIPWPGGAAGGAVPSRSEADLDPSAVTNLQAQLNQSLDHFENLQRIAPWSVIGWIALFAIVIGPLDFYLVRHWWKRPEWTWATLLIWSGLASGLAIAYGNARNQHPAEARQFDILDVDLQTQTIRGRSWYGFYSENDERYRVETEFDSRFAATPPQRRTSWVDRPGEGFRGMYGSGGVVETKPAYRFFVNQSGIENLPVRQWTTAAVNCDWETAIGSQPLVSADLAETNLNRLQGTVQHQLPGELTDWFLAYGNFLYFDRSGPHGAPAPLQPGAEWEISQAGSNLLRGRLISLMQQRGGGAKINSLEEQFERSEYDVTNPDPFSLGLVASFYKTLGGQTYTGLENDSLKRLDLSDILGLRRAVLCGRLKASPIKYALNEQEFPRQEDCVMVRIIIPVKQFERGADAPPTEDLLQVPK